MSERKDTAEQAEFREYCRRWLAENRPGRAALPAAAQARSR